MKNTLQMKVWVKDSHHLADIDRIIKACEGLAMVTVPPGQKDYLVLDYTESTQEDLLEILQDLKKRFDVTLGF